MTEEAAADWTMKIDGGRKQHKSITGTTRFYDRKVTVTNGSTAGVVFCEDQRYAYDKDTQTGKVHKTIPSANSFVFHTAQMVKAPDGTWQMANYKSQRGASRCQL